MLELLKSLSLSLLVIWFITNLVNYLQGKHDYISFEMRESRHSMNCNSQSFKDDMYKFTKYNEMYYVNGLEVSHHSQLLN